MNKWVLVTGASRGIGKETALYLASNGYNIVLHCSNDVTRLDNLKKEIESKAVQARALAFDIKNRAQVEQVLTNDIEVNGMYYGVVLNAGIAKDNPFPAMEEDEWDDVLRTNLDGFYNVLKPLIGSVKPFKAFAFSASDILLILINLSRRAAYLYSFSFVLLAIK